MTSTIEFLIIVGVFWIILNIKSLKNRMSQDIERLISELKYKDNNDENV